MTGYCCRRGQSLIRGCSHNDESHVQLQVRKSPTVRGSAQFHGKRNLSDHVFDYSSAIFHESTKLSSWTLSYKRTVWIHRVMSRCATPRLQRISRSLFISGHMGVNLWYCDTDLLLKKKLEIRWV